MSLALVRSRALDGLDAPEVTVEVHLANGLPAFNLVGLPDTEVREARERVRAALQTSQFEYPQRRITVNLAPADLPKEGGRFDLAIALGILVASGQVSGKLLDALEFCGELSLNGELRAVRGVLAVALAAGRAGLGLMVAPANAAEAALARGVTVLPAASLGAAAAHLNGHAELAPQCCVAPAAQAHGGPDMADVRGQLQARRARGRAPRALRYRAGRRGGRQAGHWPDAPRPGPRGHRGRRARGCARARETCGSPDWAKRQSSGNA